MLVSQSFHQSKSLTLSSRFLVVLLGALIGLSPLAIDMYLPGMPAIAEELSASPHAVQNTISVYLVFFAFPQLFFGPLSDAFGRRLSIFCGLAFFIAGTVLCVVAQTIETLLVARALQGTGSAAISVTVPALIKDKFSGHEYTRNVGFVMMVMAVAPLMAPLLGGYILIAGGWRAIFESLFLMALVCALAFYFAVHESLATERRTPLNLRRQLKNYVLLLKDRHCLGLSLGVGGMVAGMMAFIAGSPFVIIEVFGIDPEYYGYLFGLNVITMMGITYLNNQLIARFTNGQLLAGCVCAVLLSSCYMLLVGYFAEPALWMLMLGSVLFVGNLGMFTANVQVILLNRFSHIAGATSALIGTFRFGVGSLGGFAISLFHDHSAAPLMMVMGGCGIFVFASVLFAGRNPDRAQA